MILQKTLYALLRRMLVITVAALILGSLARLLFLILYYPPGAVGLGMDIVKALILGLRFDLTVISYINSVPLLFFMMLSVLNTPLRLILKREVFTELSPGTQDFLNRLFNIYYGLCLVAVIMITAFDTFYYSFYQDRLNVLIFGLFEDDTVAVLKTIWKDYPVIPFFVFHAVAFWLLIKSLRRLSRKIPLPLESLSGAAFKLPVFMLGIFFANGLAARGSVGLFPLSEMDTHISQSLFVNILSYNSVHAFSRALQNKEAQKGHWDANLRNFGYGNDPRQALADFFQVPLEQVQEDPGAMIFKKTPKNEWAEKNHPHVLLLVMESFGSYWTQYQQPEFDLMGDLKKDFAEDFVTLKTLSGTGSTVGSLSSLIAGVPQKTTSEFLPEGPYLNVPFRTAPAAIFKKAGYKTRFVYGGNPGWRDMNKYAHTQSFDSIEGEHDIEKALSPKVLEHHDWGIYDEDVWEYLWQTLQSATDPQFILTMTTSNHPPYQLPSTYVPPALTIPAEVKNRLLGDAQNALLRFKAFRYSNQKLSEFLNRIKNSSLKDKVVIAVTGDHTFWVVNFAETEYLEKGSVPFFLYSGRHHHSAPDSVIFASHSDIPVTLYEEALSEAPYYSFNKSIFDPSRKNLAVTAQPFVVDDKGAVMLFPGDLKRRTYFSWDPQYKELKVTEPRPELDPMAIYYQSFMGSLDYFFFSEKKRMHDANFGR